MEPLLYSPSWRKTPQSEWSTPACSTVRSLWKAGNSIAEIKRQTTIPRTTIKRWIEAKSSRTQRKGKSTRRRFVSKRQIRQIIRYIAKNWSTRRLSLEQARAHLNIEASVRTILSVHRVSWHRKAGLEGGVSNENCILCVLLRRKGEAPPIYTS